MERKTALLAVLFADIAKSTQLYDVLGDKIAQELISTCLSILSRITEQHQGIVIKTIGDEIMCTFPSASAAVEAGKAMHESMEIMTVSEKPDFGTPNLYVGIHYGPVILEGGDVFGDTVNVAARVIEQAKQRQILITEETYNALEPELKQSTQCIDTTTIKGKSGEFKLFEAIWEVQDVTIVFNRSAVDAFNEAAKSCLELRYGGKTVEVDHNRPSATLGRQDHNDLVVDTKSVSRSHARIEFRRGKFVMIDQSLNGSYIFFKDGKTIRIKQDEAQLTGSGDIFLGKMVSPDSAEAIHFKVRP